MEANNTVLQVIIDELRSLKDRPVSDSDVQGCVKNLYNYINQTYMSGTCTKETFQMFGDMLLQQAMTQNANQDGIAEFIHGAMGYYCSRL